MSEMSGVHGIGSVIWLAGVNEVVVGPPDQVVGSVDELLFGNVINCLTVTLVSDLVAAVGRHDCGGIGLQAANSAITKGWLEASLEDVWSWLSKYSRLGLSLLTLLALIKGNGDDGRRLCILVNLAALASLLAVLLTLDLLGD
jgi:hypothetical protein